MRYIMALAFIIALNMFLFISQVSTDHINPNGPHYFDFNGSMISEFNNGNYSNGQYILDENVENRLPTSEGSISQDTGTWFTDVWNSVKNWVSEKTKAKYVMGAVTAFPNFLKAIGFDPILVFALGFAWYGITLFLLVMVFKGGS